MLKISVKKITTIQLSVVFCILSMSFIGCYNQPSNNYKVTYRSDPRPIDIWHLALAHQINDNWISDKKLQKLNPNLNTIILLKVLKDGSLKTAVFEEKSGNNTLDGYAMSVVKKSAPFPPLPEGKEIYELGIVFSPKGLR